MKTVLNLAVAGTMVIFAAAAAPPATRPAATHVDLGPKEACRAALAAMLNDNLNVVLDRVVVNDGERPALEISLARYTSLSQLARAEHEAFGMNFVSPLPWPPASLQQIDDWLAHAELQTEGDSATLTHSLDSENVSGQAVMEMVRRNKVWKIDQRSSGVGQIPRAQLAYYRGESRINREMAAEIRAKKYPTYAEATEERSRRIMAMALSANDTPSSATSPH